MELEKEEMQVVVTRMEAKASIVILSVVNVDGDSLVAIGEYVQFDSDEREQDKGTGGDLIVDDHCVALGNGSFGDQFGWKLNSLVFDSYVATPCGVRSLMDGG